MSPPDTDLKEQEKQHRAPLLGMRTMVIFALVLLAVLAIFVFSRGNVPGDGEAGTSGAPEGAAVEQVEN